SRSAYWAARAAEALRNTESATQWHRLAAQYSSTYYGQLSYTKINGRPTAQSFAEAALAPEVENRFVQQENVRAARILHQLKLDDYTDSFLARLLLDAKDETDYRLIARLARELKRPHY